MANRWLFPLDESSSTIRWKTGDIIEKLAKTLWKEEDPIKKELLKAEDELTIARGAMVLCNRLYSLKHECASLLGNEYEVAAASLWHVATERLFSLQDVTKALCVIGRFEDLDLMKDKISKKIKTILEIIFNMPIEYTVGHAVCSVKNLGISCELSSDQTHILMQNTLIRLQEMFKTPLCVAFQLRDLLFVALKDALEEVVGLEKVEEVDWKTNFGGEVDEQSVISISTRLALTRRCVADLEDVEMGDLHFQEMEGMQYDPSSRVFEEKEIPFRRHKATLRWQICNFLVAIGKKMSILTAEDKYIIILKGMSVVECFMTLESNEYHYATIGCAAFYLAAIKSNVAIGDVVSAACMALDEKDVEGGFLLESIEEHLFHDPILTLVRHMIYKVGDIDVVPISLVDSYLKKLPERLETDHLPITKGRSAQKFGFKKEKIIGSAMEYLGKFYKTSLCVSNGGRFAILFSFQTNYNFDVIELCHPVMQAIKEDYTLADVNAIIDTYKKVQPDDEVAEKLRPSRAKENYFLQH